MQKIITTIVIIIVIILISFFYFTRPVGAPTQSVETVAEKVVPATNTTDSTISDVKKPAISAEKIYRISQEKSEVQFSIGEILNGAPFTAVGKTNEVGGNLSVSDTVIKVGTISVNAKTFKTDSSRRDGAIVRFILKSDQPENELITFKPAQPIALPAPLSEGKEMSTTISGDLTISGVTKPVTVAVKIKVQAGVLSVTGDATVKRSDFNLKIPELSFIASVDDAVKIAVSGVAEMVQ